jgi:hypothetical protein
MFLFVFFPSLAELPPLSLKTSWSLPMYYRFEDFPPILPAQVPNLVYLPSMFFYCSITYQARRGYHGPFPLKLPYHLPSDHAGYGLWITTGLSCTLWVAISYYPLSEVIVIRDVMY